jgi:hypothetical protein
VSLRKQTSRNTARKRARASCSQLICSTARYVTAQLALFQQKTHWARAQGGEIRATMFNDQVDQFYPILEKGGVYMISGGTIKQANKKFTHLKHE